MCGSLFACLSLPYYTRPENSIEAKTEYLFLGLKSLKQCLASEKEMASKKISVTSISILESKGTFKTSIEHNKKKYCSKSQKN